MAEGLARRLAPPGYRFYSAGSYPNKLSPYAVAALAEDGIDISHQYSKGIDDVPLAEVDTIVTLCAEEVCPVVPGKARRVHWPLPDPGQVQDKAARLTAFRETRDRLRQLLPELWTSSENPAPS